MNSDRMLALSLGNLYGFWVGRVGKLDDVIASCYRTSTCHSDLLDETMSLIIESHPKVSTGQILSKSDV